MQERLFGRPLDYDVVVRALGTVQHGDGREFLEKVIQVPFEIPTPNLASIHDSLFSKLDGILGYIPDNQWDKATWVELFQCGVKNYIKSIRDVIRYSNVFYLKYQLLQGETDPVDLLGLTCLQVFEPAIYSTLHNYKDILCGSINSYSNGYKNTDEAKIKKAVSNIFTEGTATNEEAAKSILGILFPKTQSVLGCTFSFGRNYNHMKFLINCNIAVPECFDRFFSLSLEDDAISTATIRKLIYKANENELVTDISQLYQNGKIIRLLEEIQAYANEDDSKNISSERAAILIRCLCRMWNSFEVKEKGLYFIPFEWRLLFCVDPLLRAIDVSERFSLLREIFEDKMIEPTTLALLLHNFETQHGRYTNKEPNEYKQTILLDELLKLESVFKSRCINAIDSGTALSQYGGLKFLHMLSLIDKDLVKNIQKTLITDDISLAQVISYCTSHGKTGAKIVIEIRKVNKETLSEFIDVEDAYSRMNIFVTTNEFLLLPKETNKDVVAFLISMRENEKTSQTDGFIDEETIEKELQKIVITIQP